MSKQAVMVRVPIAASWDAQDRLQIYTDYGTGTIDTTRPLLSRPVDVFPGRHPAMGVGRQPVGRGRVGDAKASRSRGGVGRTRVGRSGVGRTPSFVDVTVQVDAAFAAWQFAASAVGRDGVVQIGALQPISIVVSGTEPPPLRSFTLNSFDAGNDQAVFDVTLGTD